MAQDYFSHDYEPTADPKIKAMLSKFKGIGYGLYWRIIEMLHSDKSHKLPHKEYIMIALSDEMGTNVEQVLDFVEQSINKFDLFVSDGDHFWSERVFRNIDKRSNISEVRSQAGKKSAEMRKNSTNVKQNSTKSNKLKEKKLKEIKEKKDINISFTEFWDLYDKKVDAAKCEKRWSALTDEERLQAMQHIPKGMENFYKEKKKC